MAEDLLWVRNVARYPLWIGKERVLPGRVWSGERGFVMIALKRYPGRLVFVEPPALVSTEVSTGSTQATDGQAGSEDNPLLSAEERPSPPAPLPKSGEGSLTPRSAVKRRRKAAKANE